MLIDWFTILAQVINFLILVWLLKRFLYKPVLSALDEREKHIAAELADADAKEAEAQKEREEFSRKNQELDQQKTALLNKAREEANSERTRLLEAARQAAAELNSQLQESLRNDRRTLNETIRRRTQEEVFAISRKALADLADSSLEERIAGKFVQKIQNLSQEEKEHLISVFDSSSNSSPVPSKTALVRSAFELPDAQRKAIEEAIKEVLGKEPQIKFETAPELVSGIELTVNGQKLAWSIADYLTSLEKSIDELLKEKPKSETSSEPEKSTKIASDLQVSPKQEKTEIKSNSEPDTAELKTSEPKTNSSSTSSSNSNSDSDKMEVKSESKMNKPAET